MATPKGRAKRPVTLPIISTDFRIIRTDRLKAPGAVAHREQAGILVDKAVKALSKPGLKRDAVFHKAGIYAYSLDPRDPTKVVRESSTGKKQVGRLVEGKFKAA